MVEIGIPAYDYRAHRNIEHPTNILESTAHIIKACLGAGILGVHEAFLKCGWMGIFFTVFFGFYITYCMHILVKSTQILYVRLQINSMSYPDVAQKALETGPFPSMQKYGKTFRYMVDFIICLDLFGSCCVYTIIIAKTIQQLVEQTDVDGDIFQLRMYILSLIIPIVLICMIRTLKYLAPFSIVANLMIVACVVATFVYALKSTQRIPFSAIPAFTNFLGFFEFCGMVTFSMEGVGVVLPVENNMNVPSKFPLVLTLGMTVVVLFVLITGFFGYWGFGGRETFRTPVTLNFPQTWFPTFLKAGIAFMIYVTFAINFWAPFNLCWYYIGKKYAEEKHYIWERVYRAIICVIIVCVACALPHIGGLMGFMGSFCLSNMGFIFPAIIETLVYWHDPGLGKNKWRLWKNVVIMFGGIILFFSGTYSSSKSLIETALG